MTSRRLNLPPIAPENLIDDDLSYNDLSDRQFYLQDRLQEMALPVPTNTAANRRRRKTPSTAAAAASTDTIPMIEKSIDIHRDFLLKEMQWLAADFIAERKRHKASSRKLGNGVLTHIQSAATRRQRELDQAAAKQRLLAHKISTKMGRWWTAMDRVVTYQQKAQADTHRRAAMNQQLVQLVQQTERYTQSLAHTGHASSIVTIEQALQDASAMMRRSKRKIRDYGRLQLAPDDTELYGESTTEDSGSDASYAATEDEADDETTLRQAEVEETRRRLQKETATFVADPEELRKLQEEADLPIPAVLERLANEAGDETEETEEGEPMEEEDQNEAQKSTSKRRNQRQRRVVRFSHVADPGNDADDDGDASDVEDFVDDEFVGEEPEPDDETTMAHEEALPPELSPAQEIQLLQQESEISVEELRQRYAHVLTGNEEGKVQESDQSVVDDVEMKEADEEFEPTSEAVDDETTMEAEEKLGRDMSYQDEIALLERENEMSVEDLRKMYAGVLDSTGDNEEEGEDFEADGAPADKMNSTKDYYMLATATQKDGDEEDEFQPVAGDAVDDESTMEAEEKLGRDMSYQDEIALLKQESEMSVEELRRMYSGALDVPTEEEEGLAEDEPPESKEYHSLAGNLSQNTDDAEDEFQPVASDAVDDETTMEAEEKLGRDMSYQDEIALLKQESEMSVEELRRMYSGALDAPTEGEEGPAEDEPSESKEYYSLAGNLSQNTDDAEDEFRPAAGSAVDDETTMEAEEKLGRDMSYQDEIALLKRESEMSVEELRRMYGQIEEVVDKKEGVDDQNTEDAVDTNGSDSAAQLLETDMEDEDQEEFRPDAREAVDDETTIAAEERLGREMSYEQEIDLLKWENKMSVEELRVMYARIEERTTANEDEEVSTEYESAVGAEGDMPPHDAMERQAGETDGTSSRLKKREREERPDERETKQARLDDDTEDQASDAGKKAMDALEASAELARRTRASRPFLLAPWVKLREYQQIGLNWLVSMQTRRLNGILADEMGLGKTLQTISLLSYLASYKGIWGPHLIVVPTSVILNWETELKRFCPALKVLCYYGSAKRRKELRTGWTKSNWYHVVITSYQLAVQDAFAFKRKRWYYLVLDEAQNIKNFQSQRWQTLISFNTQRRLLLTGTPLQNSLMELWSLLHFLMPYIFRSRKEFSYWFANPMSSMIEGTSAQNDSIVHRLHGIIRPFVLRRLKKDVETQMPGKFEHIIKCQLSRRQMFIYEEFMARSSTRQALKKGGNFMGMMNVLMQLRKVCNHPDLFEPRSVVTPLALDAISYPVPTCVLNLSGSVSVLDVISSSHMMPLWCGSEGQPSVIASLKNDAIESAQLQCLQKSLDLGVEDDPDNPDEVPLPLAELNTKIFERKREERIANKKFLNRLSSGRCNSGPFAYPDRVIRSVEVEGASSKLWHLKDMATPAHLLAMRRNQQQRADDVDSLVKKFVFCVPKAGGRRPTLATNDTSENRAQKTLNDMLLEPLEESLRPFQRAHARLTSFFPDKKLIQFDSGKLQTLAELLRELKRGGHRALIFTQMSKMLDILEAFLNLNGHTYVRLDGSTGVDQRQRLMDRFNSDTKIFCFILSTRSGGMGINLTGADTVIFFDNDWNPAMDAQAQDRAHRIGQTREVHIFRLVTEHTIEENILSKAQQKRNLDILVMDQGNFDATRLFNHGKDAKASTQTDEIKDVYTKGGLRAILGVHDEVEEAEKATVKEPDEEGKDPANMESAMASLEDADDVVALRGAQKEAADELKEFDESIEYSKESNSEEESDAKKDKKEKPTSKKTKDSEAKTKEEGDEKTEEQDLEKEFAAWQDKVGMDASAIESSLSPMERYGLSFRTKIDPFYSIFAVMEERRMLEAQEAADDAMEIDDIEKEKAAEEERAMEDGDLLATFPEPEDLVRQRSLYLREKSRLRANQKLRKLTGQDWEPRIDGVTQNPFWYNIDTGEATWEKPEVLLDLEAYALAQERRWIATPKGSLVHIMSYLTPFPDRMRCAQMCRQWHKAANDMSFVLHVYPVEMSAYTREGSKMHPNHYRDISGALRAAQPGDTIELGDGHYWANEDVTVDFPVRFVGDEHNPSNVVIEMSGTFIWKAHGGFCEGITFRRPKLSSGDHLAKEILRLESGSKLDIIESILDNEDSNATVVLAQGGSKGTWRNVAIRNGMCGVLLEEGSQMSFTECSVRKNQESGIVCQNGSTVDLRRCVFEANGKAAIVLTSQSKAILKRCHFQSTPSLIHKETGCSTSCSENTCKTGSAPSLPPGFKFAQDS